MEFFDTECPVCHLGMMADKDAETITCDECGSEFDAREHEVAPPQKES